MQGKVDICGVNTSQLTVLTQAETEMLLRLAKEGDERARQRLIEGNLRLVAALTSGESARTICFRWGVLG